MNLTEGTILFKETAFNDVYERIELKQKFNKAWLCSRVNSLTGKVGEFVYPIAYIKNNYTL